MNGSGGLLTIPAGPDTLVGRATTDTLTNETLTAPAISNPSTTGTDSGSETLQNKTLTGASAGNSVNLLNAQGSASVAYALTLNGQTVWSFSTTLTGIPTWPMRVTIINTGPTTGTAIVESVLWGNTLGPAVGQSLTSLSWSSNQALSLTFNVANTDAVTPTGWLVELIQ